MKTFSEYLAEVVSEHTVAESIVYHQNNKIPFCESVFRVGSENYYRMYNTVRQKYTEGKITLSDVDHALITETDIGKFAMYEGKPVPLDSPMEAEYKGKNVELNKPKRGGDRKFYVYVKNPTTGNIKKVQFGGVTGLTVKMNDKERRKSFAARHDCKNKKDRTKPSYWSCNLPRYAKQLGLSGGGNFFW